MSVDESGRACLVTGGTRGIGFAVVERLLADGWRVAVLARSIPEGFVESLPGDCVAVPCDVSDEDSVASAFHAVHERFGRLDAVVCSAGTGTFGPTIDASLSDWRRQVDANLTGTFLVCREALRRMLPMGHGHLVNVLSVASSRPFPAAAGYVASKWGAYGLTLSLAEEVRRDGIRVSAVLPGSTDTPFWDALGGAPFDRADMLTAADVAASIAWALSAPSGVSIDEIRVMPRKGVL